MVTSPTDAASGRRAALAVALPVGAGVVAAVAIGSQGQVAAVIMVCAAIYLFAAVIGRPWAAWVGFGASFVVLAPGFVFDDPWLPIIALGVIQLALVIIGAVRGSWRSGTGRLQLIGAVVFSALAVASAAGVAPWAAIFAIAGLLGHGAWDIWHHRTHTVVTRPYALFCAALDILLAVVVAVTAVTGVVL